MDRNRTYIRLLCDNLFRKNLCINFIQRIVKLYYTFSDNSINLLKFKKNIPINKLEDYNFTSFKSTDKQTSILG